MTKKNFDFLQYPILTIEIRSPYVSARMDAAIDVLFTFDLFIFALRKKITFLQQDKNIIFPCLKSSISLCVRGCLFVYSRLKSDAS